ncbi:MAG TPA: HAD hydrolase-like protein [Gemmatimonadales bacterium]|nr:HAD hydrolase-like protein [Gemmatimonadales bacterium]
MPTRALIFDLDEALLDRRRAWQYAVEESIAAVCGERVSAGDLVAEYRLRPWSHALSILVRERQQQIRCEDACVAMYERSAMKRLLVHEGIGMGLDRVRAQRVEMGAISREPHRIAIRQIESTGLDRFLSVLSPTPAGAAWNPVERLLECCSFLQRATDEVVFVGCNPLDLDALQQAGVPSVLAAYTGCDPGDIRAIQSPAGLVELLAGLKSR